MAKKKPIVFTFGRFQPPTTGHEKLFNKVIDHAREIGGEYRIYASQNSDANRPRADIGDPLEYNDKIKFLKKMFPGIKFVKGGEEVATFMRVLYQLQKEGYTVVHMIVGDDRVRNIRNTVKQYLGGEDSETALNFDEFKVVSAGKRDPDAAGVEGMSGSKLRAAAKENNFKEFKKGMPSGFADARGLFDALRKGLEPMSKGKKKIKEETEILNEVTPPDDKSERFVLKKKEAFKDRYGDDWASYLYGVAWKQYNKRHGRPTKTRLGEPVDVEEEVSAELQEAKGFDPKAYYAHFGGRIVGPYKSKGEAWKDTGGDVDWIKQGKDLTDKEQNKLAESLDLQEGGVKASLEDWLEGLPKKVVQELKTKYGKILKKAHDHGMFAINDPERQQIRQVLIRNKVKPLMGDSSHGEGTSAVLMSFWTFHGDNPSSSVNNPNMKEEVEQIDELTIPRDAEVVGRNKEKKTVTLKWNDNDGWHEEEVPEDEVPGFYDRAADPMKKRKTDRFGNIMTPPKKGAEKKTEKVAVANKANAEDILAIFDKKPMMTPITVYGKKWGKTDEYEMVIVRRMYQGDEVFVVKSSGRFVELRATGAGLQVIDVKTKRILLDKGNDATW